MSGPVGRPHPCVPLPFSAIHGGSPLCIRQLQEPLGSSEKRPVLMPFCPAHLLFASPQHHRLTPLSTLWTLEFNCSQVINCSFKWYSTLYVHSVGFSTYQAAPDGRNNVPAGKGMRGKSRAPSERTRSLAAGLSPVGTRRHGGRREGGPAHGCGVPTGAGLFDRLARALETAR